MSDTFFDASIPHIAPVPDLPPNKTTQAIGPLPKSVQWSWLDLLLMSITSIVLFVVGIILVSLVFVLVGGQTHLQNSLTSISFSVAVAFLEFVALVGSVYLLGMVRKRKSWQSIGLHSLSRRWFWGAVGLSVLSIPVGSLLSYLITLLLRQPFTNSQLPFLAPKGSTWLSIVLLVVLTGGAIPFAEELFFRGVLYAFLRERWGVWIGAFVSAAVFGFVHFDVIVGVTAFVLGLFSAYAYERSKSLWSSVLIHALGNTLKLIILYTFIATTTKIPFM